MTGFRMLGLVVLVVSAAACAKKGGKSNGACPKISGKYLCQSSGEGRTQKAEEVVIVQGQDNRGRPVISVGGNEDLIADGQTHLFEPNESDSGKYSIACSGNSLQANIQLSEDMSIVGKIIKVSENRIAMEQTTTGTHGVSKEASTCEKQK